MKIDDLVSILNTVENFYKHLYKKGNTEKECMDEVLSGVDARISADEQDMCDRDYSKGNTNSNYKCKK